MDMTDHPDILNWQKMAEKELRGTKVESLTKPTPEGIEIKPLYTAEDLKNLDFVNILPGVDPFVRGVRATMYTN